MAILVYLALDLSLPAMPGAFVFETAHSVESIGGGRVAARVVVIPGVTGRSMLPPAQLRGDFPQRLPASGEVPLVRCPPARRLPRAACDPSQSAEDPH